jgi:hypothetical protein
MNLSSRIYLEILDMFAEEELLLREVQREEKRVLGAIKVRFDLKTGYEMEIALGESVGNEEFVTCNSMPDIHSHEISRDSFVFYGHEPSGTYYYTLFAQERGDVERDYHQNSLVISANFLSSSLLGYVSSLPAPLHSLDGKGVEEILRGAREEHGEERGVLEEFIQKNRSDLLENLFRCRSFLVVGKRPSECSRAVERISGLLGFRYGGEVSPYLSMCNAEMVSLCLKCSQRKIVGVTTDSLLSPSLFDNVIRIGEEVTYKKKHRRGIRLRDGTELLTPMEEFVRSRREFRRSDLLAYLMERTRGTELTKIRRVCTDFLESPNFSSWLRSLCPPLEAVQNRP